MPVTDGQAAALHALLSGQLEEHSRIIGQLDKATINVGYRALLAAGFFEAVERRFIVDGEEADNAAIIDFVASIRARTDKGPDVIKPDVAERMISHVLDREPSISDIDGDTAVEHQVALLMELINDAQLSESALTEFIAKVRADVDEMIE
ncbi:hypothetical protein GCM10022254_16440 [Actinomadura meridiana]|uniref:Uncharacterized protein n=1 Tax=Actinomadura meridiana TaxID=559626 RepID=A0ABP8BWX4_9ACTN